MISSQLNFNQNLHYDLGRAIGRADNRASTDKIDKTLQPMERVRWILLCYLCRHHAPYRIHNPAHRHGLLSQVALLPVSLGYRGWASTEICSSSVFSTQEEDFCLMWKEEFSFEVRNLGTPAPTIHNGTKCHTHSIAVPTTLLLFP